MLTVIFPTTGPTEKRGTAQDRSWIKLRFVLTRGRPVATIYEVKGNANVLKGISSTDCKSNCKKVGLLHYAVEKIPSVRSDDLCPRTWEELVFHAAFSKIYHEVYPASPGPELREITASTFRSKWVKYDENPRSNRQKKRFSIGWTNAIVVDTAVASFQQAKQSYSQKEKIRLIYRGYVPRLSEVITRRFYKRLFARINQQSMCRVMHHINSTVCRHRRLALSWKKRKTSLGGSDLQL